MPTQPDAYAVLQVMPDAEQTVVQAAYRALARRYHPDGTRPDSGRMVELNAAWERLRTTQRRTRYDEERRRTPVPVGPGRASETVVAVVPYDPWAKVGLASEPVGRPDPDVIDFGRYAGWRIGDLARHDPDYLRWLSRHSTGVRFLDVIKRHLPGDRSIGRRTTLMG